MANTVAGTYTVTATTGATNGNLSADFMLTNTAAAVLPPTSLVIAGGGQSATVGTAFGNVITASLSGGTSPVAAGIVVTFTATANGGAATAPLVMTASTVGTTGVATLAAGTVMANTVAGAYTVRATTSPANGNLSADFMLTNVAAPTVTPTTISTSTGTPQSVTVGTAFSALSVLVTDGTNPVEGTTVTFTANAVNGATATLGASAPTGTDGMTSVTAMAGTVTGAYTVTARVAGVSTPATFNLTNNVGAAATIVATPASTPQSVMINTAFGQALAVTISDVGGNAVMGETVTFTANAVNGATATLGTPATTGTDGMTSVTAMAGTVAGAYTVTARVAGVSTPATFMLTNNVGTANMLTPTSASASQSAAAGANFAPLAVTVDDAGGNAVGSGTMVTFTANAVSGATATLAGGSPVTVPTNGSGVATVMATAGTTTGAYTVTATVSGVSDNAIFNLSNTAVPNAIVASSGTTPQAVAIGTSFSALSVRVTDLGGAPIASVAVSFSAPTGGATAVLGTPATTDANGMTSVTATAGTVAGRYTVTARVAGVSTPATFMLTNNVGAAMRLTPSTASATQSVIPGANFGVPLTVTLADGSGNGVSGQTVTFTVNAVSGGATASLSSSTATTNAQGTASVTATAGSTEGSYTVTAAVSISGVTIAPATFRLTNAAGPSVAQTQAVISSFISSRANNILSNQPDLGGLFGGGSRALSQLNMNADDESFSLELSTSRSQLLAGSQRQAQSGPAAVPAQPGIQSDHSQSLAGSPNILGLQGLVLASTGVVNTSAVNDETLAANTTPQLRLANLGAADRADDAPLKFNRPGNWDVWAKVSGAGSDSGNNDSKLWLGYFGTHYFISETLLVGALGQVDWLEQTNSTTRTEVDGLGWMVGPYIAGQPIEGVTYEARVAYGQSDNEVKPNGTYADDFDTARWLASGKLLGLYQLTPNLAVQPHVRVSYYEERQEGYTDTIGQTVSKQEISLGEVRFGPEFINAFAWSPDITVDASLGVSGVWSFTADGGNSDQGLVIDENDLRARVNAGIDIFNADNGTTFSIEGYYDGIGASDFSAYGATIGVDVRF